MATKKVRLLCDSYLGKANDVAQLEVADVKAAKEAGLVDDHKDAVAYAESLAAAPAGEAPLE